MRLLTVAMAIDKLVKAARQQLQTFINVVGAYRGKQLTDAQADYLHMEAQKIIDELSG